MSEVWSGNISTDDPATCIQGNACHPAICTLGLQLDRDLNADYLADVRIWAPNSSTRVPLIQDAKLHFLSLVEVARIPFHFAAGPSCDVFTGNEATTNWLTEALLNGGEEDTYEDALRDPWWLHLGRQSENGILLRLETDREEESEVRKVVTEVLLYAAVTQTCTGLLTPAASSSPAPPDEDFAQALNQGANTIQVYALPLCSNTGSLAKTSMEVCLPSPTEFQSAGQASFLPHTQDTALVTQPIPQKRQSISILFEDATTKRRKFRGRGGESISQAMAGIDRLPSQHGLPEKQEAPQLQQNDLRRKSLSRASSMPSVAVLEITRPASRSGPLANGKRSSLHQVESAILPRDSTTPSDVDGSCGQQNKAALTKVIMAGMRLHGLQQKKRPSTKSQFLSQATMHTETIGGATEADDEYKVVYHQTFKAAMFTFRKHLNALLISQEKMRDVVDRLLTMFCTDPMMVDRAPDGNEFEGFEANNGLPSSSPFDKPSRQARCSNIANGWNTPTVKKG